MEKYIITIEKYRRSSNNKIYLRYYNGEYFDDCTLGCIKNIQKRGDLKTYSHEDGIKKIKNLKRYYNRNYNRKYKNYNYNFKKIKLFKI